MDEARLAKRVARDFVAARGLQVRRKDKDLMSDTGGTSKGRDREPHLKPPRDDVKKPHRTKRKTKSERDPDIDNDPDLKKGSEVHPLDRKTAELWGQMPEDNYHRRVKGALHGILESERGVSEKDFGRQDRLSAECDAVVRHPAVEDIIQRFKRKGCRPPYCAECIYDHMRRET
jgi:hypothetical protein